MNFQKIFVPLFGLALMGVAYSQYGWQGVAIVVGGLIMFLLLHFTRMMKVLERARNTPVGHVASAVMLNAKLKPGVSLLHVIAMTRSLGVAQTPEGQSPEIFRWTDESKSWVDCQFVNGKLTQWNLVRPEPAQEAVQEAPAP